MSLLDRCASLRSFSNFWSFIFYICKDYFQNWFWHNESALAPDLASKTWRQSFCVCLVITFINVCSPGINSWQPGNDRLTLHKRTSVWLPESRRRQKRRLLALCKGISESSSNAGLEVVEKPWAAEPLFSFISHFSLPTTSLKSCHAFIRTLEVCPFFSSLIFTPGMVSVLSVPRTKAES